MSKEGKAMKPNIPFLRKVRDRKVFSWFSYRQKTGGRYGFTGGEATYEKHARAGFVTNKRVASLGRPGYIELTQAGIEALAQADVSA